MSKYRIFSLLAVLFVSFTLTGCDAAKNQTKLDREGDLEAQDYRDGFAPREPEVTDAQSDIDNIPPLMPYVSPVSENLEPMPLVSVNLNQSVPLRDALYELAKEAEYDLELDPKIRGAIIFTAREKPFDVVIQRIADVAGLRYTFEENTLRLERDTAYSETYKIDFLNIVRNSASQINNNIAVVSGEGADTGSSFSADTASVGDFWAELEANISQILNAPLSQANLSTSRNPEISVSRPEPLPVERAGASGGQEGAEAGGQQTAQRQEAEPPQATLQVESLPLDESEEETGEEKDAGISFSLNKQAGIILVHAPQRLHKKVEQYLQMLKKSVTAQVLIEAKVLEVSLRDEFAAGIEWSSFDSLGDASLNFLAGNAVAGSARDLLEPQTSPNTNLNVGVIGNDAGAVVDAISRFGTVKALASPRLTVLNNQPAVLNVATNLVYFEIDIDRTEGTDGQGDTVEIDSEIRNVPEGVLINVLPSIDLDTNKISLSVRPTVTRVVNRVADPGVAFVAAGGIDIESLIPEVNVQEIDSVIEMNSGEAVVMGGLMQDRSESEQNAVPVLGEMPLLGSLFRNKSDQIQKTELVIFLKATIVNNGGTIHNTDRDIYKMFSGDRRPLKM